MKKVLVFVMMFAVALAFSDLAAASGKTTKCKAPAKATMAMKTKTKVVTLEGEITKEGKKCIITLDKNCNGLVKGDKVTIKGKVKMTDKKVTGTLSADKKEITVKKKTTAWKHHHHHEWKKKK